MAKEILIVDSEKGDRLEFKKFFETTHYNIIFSENGEQALLRIKLFKPDLIILGTSFEEESGLEVFKAIKADVESRHIPVIFLSSLFEEIPEEDRKRFQADGVITKPFHEDEVLNLVDRLVEEGEMGSKKEGIIGREMEWGSVADVGKGHSKKEEEFLLDKVEKIEEEDEIIDLVEVVEEPESKMSIQEFIAAPKEEPLAEITPLESWEKMIEEEKPSDKRFKYAPDEIEREAKGLLLQLDEELAFRGQPSEKEPIDKIELEEILRKVEQLAPAIEKEWPSEIKQEVSQEAKQEIEEPILPVIEEPAGNYAGLAEFEAALKRGVGGEPPEKEAPSLYTEKPKMETPEEAAPIEISLEDELKKAQGEEFSESLKPKMETLEEAAPIEISLEDELKKAQGEEFSESLFEELREEEDRAVEEPKGEEIEIFEEVNIPEIEEEEIELLEKPEKEMIGIFEEAEALEVPSEEVEVFEEHEEERVEMLREVEAPEVTVPIVEREEIIIPSKAVEQQMEEVISKGAREMMEGFIIKLVPEMTHNIINLTLERIERMVKEIVPDLAQKMIQEEIKRLQKGEKD